MIDLQRLLKECTDLVLAPFGFEIRHKKTNRNTMQGALTHIGNLGFEPNSIIDDTEYSHEFEIVDILPIEELSWPKNFQFP